MTAVAKPTVVFADVAVTLTGTKAFRPVTLTAAVEPLFATEVIPVIRAVSRVNVPPEAETVTFSISVEVTPAPRVISAADVMLNVSLPAPPLRLSPAVNVAVADAGLTEVKVSAPAPVVLRSTPVVRVNAELGVAVETAA